MKAFSNAVLKRWCQYITSKFKDIIFKMKAFDFSDFTKKISGRKKFKLKHIVAAVWKPCECDIKVHRRWDESGTRPKSIRICVTVWKSILLISQIFTWIQFCSVVAGRVKICHFSGSEFWFRKIVRPLVAQFHQNND